MGMLPQVEEESVTGPAAFGFYHLKGNTLKEILECGPNSDPMALEGIQKEGTGSLGHDLKHLGFCEGAMAFSKAVGKERAMGRRGVDLEVGSQGCFRVCKSMLLGPRDLFTRGRGLGAREVKCGHFQVVAIMGCGDMSQGDMYCVEKGARFQVHYCEFSQAGSQIEGGGEAGEDSCMERRSEIKLAADCKDVVNCEGLVGLPFRGGRAQGLGSLEDGLSLKGVCQATSWMMCQACTPWRKLEMD